MKSVTHSLLDAFRSNCKAILANEISTESHLHNDENEKSSHTVLPANNIQESNHSSIITHRLISNKTFRLVPTKQYGKVHISGCFIQSIKSKLFFFLAHLGRQTHAKATDGAVISNTKVISDNQKPEESSSRNKSLKKK